MAEVTKNLANCSPREFLKQTNLIRKSVERWLTVTDVLNIRKRVPSMPEMKASNTKEENAEIMIRRRDLMREQSAKNISAMLDSIMEEHPDETIELLALLCFIEPEDADNHPMKDYIKSIGEMLNDEAVMDFFISLVRLGQINTENIAEA